MKGWWREAEVAGLDRPECILSAKSPDDNSVPRAAATRANSRYFLCNHNRQFRSLELDI